MKKNIISHLLLCLMVLTTTLTAQNTVYVNTTGDDLNNGLSESTPVKTLVHAVSIATAEESTVTEIVMAPGTYEETATAELSTDNCPNLLIRGASAKTTIIKSTGTGRILNTSGDYLISSNTLTIRDITLRDANATNLNGGAIYFGRTANVNNNLTLERVVFENNITNSGTGNSNGGAIFFSGNELMVSDCYFKNNKALKLGNVEPTAGAIAIVTLGSTNGVFATITNSTFEGNEAFQQGGAIYFSNNGGTTGTVPNSYVNIVNCTFLDNKVTKTSATANAGAVMLIASASTANFLVDYKIVNCTFLNNSSGVSTNRNTLVFNGTQYNSAIMVNNLIAPLDASSSGAVLGANNPTGEKLKGSNNLIGGDINTITINSSYFRTDSIANNNLTGWREDFFINSSLTNNSTETEYAVPYLELTTGSAAINFGISSYGDPNIVPATDVRGASTYGVSKDIGAFELNPSFTEVITPSVNDLVKLYPNPVRSVFYLDVNDVLRADIFTLNGMKIQSIKNPRGGIDASELAQGMYLIHVYTEKGTFTKSFVKL